MSEKEKTPEIVRNEWKRIPLDRLFQNPDNVNEMDSRITKRLRKSLDRAEGFGVVQNLVVMPSKKKPGWYMILGGNHRYEVLMGAKRPPKTVMCCIVPYMPKERRMLLCQAINNIHGSDNREKASALYERIIREVGAQSLDDFLGHQATVQRIISNTEEEVSEVIEGAGDKVDEERGASQESGGAERIREVTPNTVYHKDSLKIRFPENSFDAIVTDPPYQIGVFENKWDSGADVFDFTKTWLPLWLDSVKPGGFFAVCINSRQYDLVTCAMRECGLLVRDPLIWIRYISKIAGKRLNKGGTVYTTLKNCAELIAIGQKKPEGTFKENFDKYGVGGFFFKDALLPYVDEADFDKAKKMGKSILELARAGKIGGRGYRALQGNTKGWYALEEGRRPSNVIVFPGDAQALPLNWQPYFCIPTVRSGSGEDEGHETQKPLALMSWIIKLLCPRKGIVADPFGGSGTTGVAAIECNRRFVLVEKKRKHAEASQERCSHAGRGSAP
jgi:DNA modification methylase